MITWEDVDKFLSGGVDLAIKVKNAFSTQEAAKTTIVSAPAESSNLMKFAPFVLLGGAGLIGLYFLTRK